MNTTQLNNITLLSADESKYIHKIGTEMYCKKVTMLPSETIEMYEEVNEIPKFTKSEYEDKVKELIKERYTIEDELAIQRKAFNAMITPTTLSEDSSESIMDEFTEYNTFVEECKVKAVEILNNKTNGEES